MESGENLLCTFFARVGVALFDDLRIVFNDGGKHLLRQDIFPEVGGLQAVGVDRIACALLIALIEGQKPRAFAGKPCAELDIAVVHGEVNHTALELKEQFFWVAVGLVLLNGVEHILSGEAVLQLAGHYGQAIDEYAQIEGEARMIRRILKLTGDAEDILRETHLRGVIAFGRELKKGVEAGRAVLEALAKHIHHTPTRYLTLKPV